MLYIFFPSHTEKLLEIHLLNTAEECADALFCHFERAVEVFEDADDEEVAFHVALGLFQRSNTVELSVWV